MNSPAKRRAAGADGFRGPRWFSEWVQRGLAVDKVPKDVPQGVVERIRGESAGELDREFSRCDQELRATHRGLEFNPDLQCVMYPRVEMEPCARLSEVFLEAGREEEGAPGGEGGARRRAFDEARAYLEENLFITHPFNRAMLDLWVSKYSSLAFFRAMDLSMFPMDQEMFEQLQHAQCQYAREVLLQNWVAEVRAIFARLPEHEWVPPHLHDRFLESVRCLQSQHLGGTLAATAEQIVGLFNDFAGTDDDAAMFILNVTVSSDARVIYMPDPMDALHQAKDMMDLVKTSICMVPVVPSSLASTPRYNSLLIMKSRQADTLLEEAKNHLDQMFREQMEGPEELLAQYDKFQFVLSEPYYPFPVHWHHGNNWRKYHPQWLEIWARSEDLADQIELETETEVDVGMFVAITSAPPEVGLITEVLTDKALSLGRHIKETVAAYISDQARELVREYGEIDALFKEDAKNNPKRLVVLLDLLKGTDKRLKAMGKEGARLKEMFEALWDAKHIFEDGEFSILIECFHNSATMREKLQDANTQFRETKWLVEEELRRQRNDLQSALLDMMQAKIREEVILWDKRHMFNQYLERLAVISAELDEKAGEGVVILRLEEEFGWPQVPIQLLDEITRDIAMHRLLWDSIAKVPKVIRMWHKMNATEINPDRMEFSAQEWARDLSVMLNHFSEDLPAHGMAQELQGQVLRVIAIVPVLRVWVSPVLMEWHWQQIGTILSQELLTPELIPLGTLDGWEVEKFQEQLAEIEGNALVEFRLQKTLESMEEQWVNFSLPIRSLGASGTYYVVSVREGKAIVQDQLVKLDSVMSADSEDRYAKGTSEWRNKVLYMQELLNVWWQTQKHFLRVRPIFASRDVSEHLSRESLLFSKIDALWRQTMARAVFAPSLSSLCNQEDLLEPFMTLEQDLVVLNLSLNSYLEKTRQAVPRLYFPSEPELLDILASGYNDVKDINLNINRLFPGVRELMLREDDRVFWAVEGAKGEMLEIIPGVDTKGTRGVDTWLPLVEENLKNSVRKAIDRARVSRDISGMGRIEWMMSHTQQSVAVANDVFYTDAVECALMDDNRGAMLAGLVPFKEAEIQEVLQSLYTIKPSGLQRHLHVALCIQDIAHRDILSSLVQQDPRSVHDFAWQCQLRSYWDVPKGAVDGVVRAEMMHRSFVYGNEYTGSSVTLVWTESLQRAYKIIGTALAMQLGSQIHGVSHSGRSAYISELAGFLGTFCVTCDCSLQPSHAVVDRLCKGLASSGGWVCFKELPRVREETMSTLSLALLAIQQALRAKADTCLIAGDEMSLPKKLDIKTGMGGGPPPCAFITVGAKRLGDTEIPDTVRVLFRPIHLGMPDAKTIVEVQLMANGLSKARSVARRAIFIYRLFVEQLSHLSHYDFSHAALMMTVRIIIGLKVTHPDEDEMKLLNQALLFKAPAMSPSDLPAFKDALNDVISGGDALDGEERDKEEHKGGGGKTKIANIAAKFTDNALLTQIQEHCAIFKEHTSVDWLAKVVGLYENLNAKGAVMLVGKPFSGKSSCIRALAPFVGMHLKGDGDYSNRHIEVVSVFPKALSHEMLYGKYHDDVGEFTDGVIPAHFRQMAEARSDKDSRLAHAVWWTVLDGPVDPLWSDGLSSVLGDRGYMQLPHGEHVRAPKDNKFIFQCEDLVSAAPSLVARCGIVYLHTQDDDWEAYANCWLGGLDPRILGSRVQLTESNFARADHILEAMMEMVVRPTLEFLRNECTEPVALVSDIHRVHNLMRFFGVLCKDVVEGIEVDQGGVDRVSSGKPGTAGTEDPKSRPSTNKAPTTAGSTKSGGIERPGAMPTARPPPTSGKGKEEEEEVLFDFVHADWVQPLFFFAIVWSVCASTDGAGRAKVDAFLRDLCFTSVISVRAERRNGKHTRAEMKLNNMLPRFGSVYDYAYFDQSKSRSGWVSWSDLQPSIANTGPKTDMNDLVVPTVDFSRYFHLLDYLMVSGQPMLLTGPPASGKTFYLHCKVTHGLPASKYGHVLAHFSAQSTPENLQRIIEAKLEQRKRGALGPTGDRKLIVQIEDLNLPTPDQFGAQPVLELVRQLIDQAAWYSLSDPDLTLVEDVSVCGAMPVVRDSRQAPIPSRLLRQMHVLHVSGLSEADMRTIFAHTLKWYHETNGFPKEILDLEPQICDASLAVYARVRARLRPTPSYPQYSFSLRDLRRVLEGMCLQTAEDVMDFVDSAANEHTRLWAHEVLRVFYDRIRDSADREWFLDMVKDVTQEQLKMNFNVLFAHLDQDGDGDIDSEELRRLFFGHYTTEGVDTYDELTDFEEVISQLKTRVKKFEAWSARSSFLSISLYQAEHITRISRVLQLKRGHMLLVGCSGAGKRSMVRLATHMSQMEMMEFDPEQKVMEPLPAEEEGTKEQQEHSVAEEQKPPPQAAEPPTDLWRHYLREAILSVGTGEVQRGVLLLRGPFMTDAMYEDLNCILNGIDIPDLFTHAEQVEIVTDMRANHVTGGDHSRNFNISEMFTVFTQMAYDRLHVCLCLDSYHDNLQQKVALFPCLITRTTVNYLQDWPVETMRAIAVHVLEGTNDTFLAGEIEKAEKAQKEEIEQGVLETQADLDDYFVDESHGLDEDLLPERTGKVKAKDAANRIKKMRQQIEKEEQIRSVCERMHNIAVEVEEQFMGSRGRTKEYICMTHFTYFLRCYRVMILDRRAEIQGEIDLLIPCLDQVRKVLNRKVEEERARKLYEQEEEVLRQAGKAIEERIASVQEVVDSELVNVDQCKKTIKDMEAEIETITSELDLEKMKLITIWNQATQALATMTARDVGKLKASLNVTAQTPDAVRLLVYACVALLDGTRAEDRVEKSVPGTVTKAEQDPLILCRPVIAGSDFKKRLIGVDRESATLAAGAKIIKDHYATNPSFTMDLCLQQCAGSEKLFQWIAGVLIFFEKTREVVKPLEQMIEEKKKKLAEQNAVMDTHMGILKVENEKMDGLEVEKRDHARSVEGYAGRKGDWEKETMRASELVQMIKGDVANFWKEWNQRLKLLEQRRDKVDEDCLLAAASISYLGGMRPLARETCHKRWLLAMEDAGLWVTEGLTAVDFVCGYPALSTLTSQWEAMGLPTDEYTLLNAVIIMNGWCVPLIIDPHDFAANFVRAFEASIGSELMELNADTDDIVGRIKYAVEQGIPVLLENVSGEQIAGSLSHVLSRQTFIRRKRRYVHIGDDAVLCQDGFKLYITTRDERPKLEQDVTMWVNVVDFDLTSEGLSLALRSTLLREKAPDLFEYCRQTLTAHIEAVHELEAHDLKPYFHGSERTVIKNDEVLASFSSALEDWIEIRRVALQELRNYRVGIQRAELLDALTRPLVAQYECLWELRVLHPSYQNVYNGFINLILSDLGTEGRQEGVGDDDDEDINMMAMSNDLFADMRLGFGEGEEMVHLDEAAMKADLETLSHLVFQAVFFDLVRSIYERHHLVFTFAVAVKKMFASDSMPAEEWQHFLTDGRKRVPLGAEVRGTQKVEIIDGSDMAQEGFGRHGNGPGVPGEDRQKPAFEWLSDEHWAAAQRLSPVRSLTHALREELCESIENNPEKWEPFFKTSDPVECEDPKGIRASLSPFQLLLLIRAFHPHHIMEGMRHVALRMYGVDAYRIPSVSIAAAHEDSTNVTPLMFLLGPGSDPTRDIEAFADDMLFLDKLVVIESRASTVTIVDKVLQECMERGHWLLVRNIHTHEPMMSKLEDKCAELLKCEPHTDFRLWITSFPTGLSKEVYRQSMRIVWEAPNSLRGNLLQSFTTDPMTNQDFFYITKNTLIYKKCMFALCFLHAAVKERAVYGAFGWNNVPAVDAFDLKYCMVQMRDVIEGFDSISVRSLRQLVSDLVYVGRITHKRDGMILEALSGRYFSDKLLNEGHTYTADGVYYPPEGSAIEKYLAYVDNLPTSSPAALFGLPVPMDHVRAEQQAEKTMSYLHDMQGFNVARKEGVPWQHPVVMTSKAAELLELVPGLFNVDEVEKAYPLVRSENRNRVLLQELQLHNVLTRAVRNSLERLMACMKGEERLDAATDRLAKDVYYGRVPDEWMRHSLPSEKPLIAYLRHLAASNTFFQKWVRAGIPSAFWLPAFFFPQAVASATTVNYCRHELVGIETVVLEHIVLDAEVPNVVRVPITDGAYVIGLTLVGAGWNRTDRVLTCPEDMSLSAPFPALQLRPKQGQTHLQKIFAGSRAQVEKRKQRGRRASVVEAAADLISHGRQNYLCPIYRTSARSDSTRSLTLAANNLVFEVDLPCALPGGPKNEHLTYVMRGTALIIQSDD